MGIHLLLILEDYRNVVDEGFVASKIIHRIIFEGSFVFTIGFWNPFLLQKGSKPPQMRLTIKNPPAAACAKGLCPLETHNFLKKIE